MAEDDSKMLLGVGLNEADARAMEAAVKELAEKVGADLERLAEGEDGEARKLQLDTKEAVEALAQVSEEAEKTGRTSEESLARAEAALRKLGPTFGFKEDLKLVAPEFEEISRASAEAGAAVERFGKLAESGSKGAERAAVQADLAVERLAAEIERTRATGGPVPQEWERRLASYRQGLERGQEAAGRFAASQRRVQDELAKSREKFASMEDQARTLPEAIIRKWPAAEATVVSFGAALATLEVSYAQTREFVKWTKEHFGVDIDAGIQKAIQSTIEYLRFEKGFRESSGARVKQRREDEELERNAARISSDLRRREGETLEELVVRIDNYRNGLRQLLQEQEKSGRAQRAFIEAASGTTLEKLQERISNASEVVKAFGGDFEAISKSGLFPEFSSEIDGIVRALERYGAAFRLTLEGEELKKFDALLLAFQTSVREKLVGTVQYAAEQTRLLLESFGIQTPEAIRKSTESLESLIETLGGLGGVSREQAEKIATEAQRILQAIALLPAEQREALADITASLHATSDAYREHAESVVSFSASGTEAVQKATEDRIAAWEREKAALSGLVEAAGTARDELLKSLEPAGRQPSRGDRQTDPRSELQDLKLKPIQSEEDLARIAELEDQLGGLREKQREATAGSEEVAQAIARFREELASTGTTLSDLDKGAIKAFLSRLQQTADEGGATAAVIEDAFGAVNRTVTAAQKRAELLASAAARTEQIAAAAAQTARGLGQGVEDIVASVDKSGQLLVSNLETAVNAGNELVERTVDTGKKATQDVVAVVVDGQQVITQAGSATAQFIEKYSDGAQVVKETIEGANKQTESLKQGITAAGTAVSGLARETGKLGEGMETVALETAKAGSSLETIADSAEGASEGIRLIAAHAASAGEPVAKLAGGLETAAASKPGLEAAAAALADMAKEAPQLANDLSRLEPAEKIQARAEAYKALSVSLQACAVAAGRLRAALPSVQEIRREAEALEALADALERVASGLESERAAREGEEATN